MEANRARASLEQAVVVLVRDLPRLAAKDACERLAVLKRQAVLENYLPTAVLAEGLASAITRDGRKVPLATWIDALSLAAGCGTENPQAGPLLLATIGVRFAA